MSMSQKNEINISHRGLIDVLFLMVPVFCDQDVAKLVVESDIGKRNMKNHWILPEKDFKLKANSLTRVLQKGARPC